MATIDFTWRKHDELQDAYDRAITQGKNSFIFEGQELLVSYAKYLLEYLNIVFNAKIGKHHGQT